MPEHRIRLRGAWECQILVDEESTARRVDLPVLWAEPTPFPHQFVRQFGRPPVDPEREEVSLELRRVTGLATVRLNGRELARVDPSTAEHLIPLPLPLLPRNALLLEVDPGLAAAGDSWGEIALKISPLTPEAEAG